jgi:hypothetical protein
MLLDSTPPAFASIPSIELFVPFVFFLKLWHVPLTKSHIQHQKSKSHVTKSRSRSEELVDTMGPAFQPICLITFVLYENFLLYYYRG